MVTRNAASARRAKNGDAECRFGAARRDATLHIVPHD
jgi:hypothetical protein